MIFVFIRGLYVRTEGKAVGFLQTGTQQMAYISKMLGLLLPCPALHGTWGNKQPPTQRAAGRSDAQIEVRFPLKQDVEETLRKEVDKIR